MKQVAREVIQEVVQGWQGGEGWPPFGEGRHTEGHHVVHDAADSNFIVHTQQTISADRGRTLAACNDLPMIRWPHLPALEPWVPRFFQPYITARQVRLW